MPHTGKPGYRQAVNNARYWSRRTSQSAAAAAAAGNGSAAAAAAAAGSLLPLIAQANVHCSTGYTSDTEPKQVHTLPCIHSIHMETDWLLISIQAFDLLYLVHVLCKHAHDESSGYGAFEVSSCWKGAGYMSQLL